MSKTRNGINFCKNHPDKKANKSNLCNVCYTDTYGERASCHPEKPVYKATGICRSCYDKELLARNPEYKQRQIENAEKWRQANQPHRKAKEKERQEKRRTDPILKARDKLTELTARLRKLGITVECYQEILKDQNNTCKICHQPPAEGKSLHIDHDHVTGLFRGILCFRCNWYLGLIEKAPETLNNLNKYVKDIYDKRK